MTIENINFLRRITNQAEITAGLKLPIPLKRYQNDFGLNFNTFSIGNQAVDIEIYLDGVAVQVVEANDTWGFDWQDGIKFSSLEIKNLDGAVAIAISTLYMSIGRTGFNK